MERALKMLRGLARLFIFIYQIFFLLGLYRRYLYKTDIEDQNTEDGSKGTASQAPRMERNWEQVFRERSQYFTEHYVPLLLNGSAFYFSTSAEKEVHPILMTIRIIAVVISANASLLSAFLIHWIPVLFNPSFHKGLSSAQKQGDRDRDRATQVAMLKSVPQASSFWSLGFTLIYHSSRYAIVDGGPKEREAQAQAQLNTDGTVTGRPLWSTILIFTVLSLCAIHFFVIVVWLNALSSQGDGTTANNSSVSHKEPSSNRPAPSAPVSNEEGHPQDSASANTEAQLQDPSDSSKEQYAGMDLSHPPSSEKRSRKRKGAVGDGNPGPEAIEKTNSTASGVQVGP